MTQQDRIELMLMNLEAAVKDLRERIEEVVVTYLVTLAPPEPDDD